MYTTYFDGIVFASCDMNTSFTDRERPTSNDFQEFVFRQSPSLTLGDNIGSLRFTGGCRRIGHGMIVVVRAVIIIVRWWTRCSRWDRRLGNQRRLSHRWWWSVFVEKHGSNETKSSEQLISRSRGRNSRRISVHFCSGESNRVQGRVHYHNDDDDVTTNVWSKSMKNKCLFRKEK